jgi:hypothetical protein
MTPESNRSPLPDSSLQDPPSRTRVRFGLIIATLGFFIFMVGAKPAWFGWDNSPVVGFIQVAVLLVGLGIVCVGGYLGLLALWKGRERTIAADIGMRLVATGYVVSVFAGMADVFGMGTQTLPNVPFFGPLQARGIIMGQALIAIGFLLMIPFQNKQNKR